MRDNGVPGTKGSMERVLVHCEVVHNSGKSIRRRPVRSLRLRIVVNGIAEYSLSHVVMMSVSTVRAIPTIVYFRVPRIQNSTV